MSASFPRTRHSVIERIRTDDPASRREAFGDLVTGYWKPVYKHLRRTWRLAEEDAQDLTQAFFSEAFQKAWLERYDPGRARFRTFVRMCADRFVMNHEQSAGRLKRGGGTQIVAWDFDGAERELQLAASTAADADDFFRAEFVRALFDRAVTDVKREYRRLGRETHLTLFDRYDLDPAEGTTYTSLAKEMGLTPSQVTNYLAQIRRSFRLHALEALRALTGTDEEFRREAKELFGLEIE